MTSYSAADIIRVMRKEKRKPKPEEKKMSTCEMTKPRRRAIDLVARVRQAIDPWYATLPRGHGMRLYLARKIWDAKRATWCHGYVRGIVRP